MLADTPRVTSIVQTAQGLHISATAREDLERVVAGLKRADLTKVPHLKPLRVKILGNITTDYLADYLRLMLVRCGFGAAVAPGHYGALVSELLGPHSPASDDCDACIVVLNHRDIQFPPSFGIGASEAQALVQRETDFWESTLRNSKVPTVVLSFDLPAFRALAELDGLVPGGLGWHVKMTNLQLAARLPANATFVDAEALQIRVGATHWFDAHVYHLCKQPFAMEALPEIAHTLAAALTGLLGRARKVLVLDLDNTLWGGVVGDDGLQGIEIGPETAEGEAFVALQAYAKELSKRGIVLAVCSKNREEAALAPFREHSAMVLREADISCFVANFDDKATNLRRIAKTLNLGLDSFVFVDDNPVERALIRNELPEVLVIELPENPAYYVGAIDAAKAFPLHSLTREDLGRVASYKVMAAVQDAAATPGGNLEEFLSGLDPVVHIERIDSTTVDRIVQLIRKTNQFKLNPTVFSEAQIMDEANSVLALRLTDRLQDYGIVAIAVSRASGQEWEILNWVMSCRVFGRHVEDVMLEALCKAAKERRCPELRCEYTASEKNVIIPEILARLGFDPGAVAGEYRRSADRTAESPHSVRVIDRR